MNYNKLALAYAPNRTINPALLKHLLSMMRLDETTNILEIGCGSGNYIGAIDKASGSMCYGIDPSREMLVEARNRQPTVDFQLGSAGALPFERDRFDLVYSVDVIHHVVNISSYFKEARRVLRSGGLLCTATDSADDIGGRRPLSSHFPETIAVELARYPTIERLKICMEEIGFTGIAMDNIPFSYSLTDLEPFRQRAFSCLHLIEEDAFERGLRRMEAERTRGPIEGLSLYTLLWGLA